MSHKIQKLSPLIFPDNSDISRDEFFKPEDQFPDFAEKYDYKTLFYQAIDDGDQTRLLAPRLLNFERILRDSEFSSNGKTLPIKKIQNYRRHAEIILKGSGPKLKFRHRDFETEVETLPRSNSLDEQNLIVTRQKNNPLKWVKIWATHHVEHQGVTAIVIVDNGSTDYQLEELSQTLSEVNGLNHSLVIDAPFRFGPIAQNRPRNRGLFYQAAMLNLVKQCYATNANGVLCCVDIDELIYSQNDETIFDEMQRSRLGYVTIPGHWRYAKIKEPQRIRHSDHIYRSQKRDWSREKYCVNPKGPMRRLPWDIHNVGRGRLNKYFQSKSKGFYHCEQLSTSWIVKRNEPTVNDLKIDQQTQEFFAQNIEKFETSLPQSNAAAKK